MKPDPRVTVCFCLVANLVVMLDGLLEPILIKAIVMTWLGLATLRRPRMLLLGLAVDLFLALILGLLSLWADIALEQAAVYFLRWSIIAWAGLILLGVVGAEDFLRVLMWCRLPRLLSLPLGFAVRSIPLVGEEILQVRRHAAAHRQSSQERLRLRDHLRFLEQLSSRCLGRLHHVVSQVERRGFRPAVFGTLARPRWSAADLLGLLATVTTLGLTAASVFGASSQ